MIRKYFLIFLAILGALFGLIIVFWSQKTVPPAPILLAPARSPYPHSIAGAGIIEASSQNISIGCPFNEVITHIFVTEGDHVKAGDPLFQLDLRSFNAQVEVAQAGLEQAIANYQDKEKQFSFYTRLKNTKAVSEQAYQQSSYASLDANTNVKVAQANLLVAQANLERATIRAPIDGVILQLNIHVGEIAPIIPFVSAQSSWLTASQGSLMLMGRVEPLQVRIDIDEDDAWRFQKGAKATAFVRGNSAINFPLEYVRTEPYIIPKVSFTGANTERVDTRVLQALYSFEKGDLPVYAGQILDIFIESQPIVPSKKQ